MVMMRVIGRRMNIKNEDPWVDWHHFMFVMCSLYFQLNQQAKIPWGDMEYLDPLISDAVLMGCLTCSQKLFHVVTCCAHFCRELSRPWRPSTPYDPCFLKPSSSSNDKFSDYFVPHIYTHVQWWCRTLLRKGSKVVDIFGQDLFLGNLEVICLPKMSRGKAAEMMLLGLKVWMFLGICGSSTRWHTTTLFSLFFQIAG